MLFPGRSGRVRMPGVYADAVLSSVPYGHHDGSLHSFLYRAYLPELAPPPLLEAEGRERQRTLCHVPQTTVSFFWRGWIFVCLGSLIINPSDANLISPLTRR